MIYSDRRMPSSSSSHVREETEQRDPHELRGLSVEEAEARLKPKEREQSKPSSSSGSEVIKKPKHWVAHVEKTYGLHLSKGFFEGLSVDEDEDISRLVALVAPVLAKVHALNPSFKLSSSVARRIMYAQPEDAEGVMVAVMQEDTNLELIVPKEFDKAAELQQRERDERGVRREKQKLAYEQGRREILADAMMTTYDESKALIELAIHVLDAYVEANPHVRCFKNDRIHSNLGDGIYFEGVTDKQGLSRVLLAMAPEANIPESIDPEGAQRQMEERELARLQKEQAARERDEREDAIHLKQRELRSELQQHRAGRLVEGAQSLHGTLNWCKSGFETGSLEGTDVGWYESQGKEVPHQGQGDPRARQLDHDDKVVDNAFVQWIRCDKLYDETYQGEPAPEPSQGSFMNCWEGVIFAAYKAGLMDKVDIIEAYRWFKESGNPDAALLKWLGYDKSCLYKAGTRVPSVGDILFYAGNEHVAIYKGNGRVLQLWHDGRLHLVQHNVAKKDDHRESDWDELAGIGHEIRFAPSPF